MSANKWLFFAILAVTLFYASGKKSRRNKKRCIQFVTVILTCFAGFRSWRMGDCSHYCFAYLSTNLPDWTLAITETGDTVGLQLLYRFMGQLGLSFEFCLFVISAFVAISLGILVFRYSSSPFWSYAMYLGMGFYLASMDLLKQYIAMGILMFAMIAILEHRPLRFLVLVCAAALFHTPAWVFLIAYPFANKKIDWLYFFLIAAMVVGVFLFRDQIIDFATSVYYEESTSFEAVEVLGGKTVLMVLFLLLGLFLRPLQRYDTKYCQVFNIMVLAVLAQSFSVYDNVFTRLADYFYQFVVLFVPMMLQPAREQAKSYPNYTKQIRYWPMRLLYLVQLCLVVFVVYFYTSTINGSYELLKDFMFIWQVEDASSLELLAEMLKDYHP